ncbi:response regulator transcription factor [Saccharomonospora sp. NPDC046836]|uniref:response regulator transcription factor n=1 Tax=Saccharomonospora sp. NPDC046836 TaxID=3156921 RepID=UPI0033EA1405
MHTVLLVEDDPAVQAALARTLSANGYDVRTAGTAADALRDIASLPLELVILDLGLPDLDGSSALRMIRGVSDVPVIIATARRDEGSVVRLLNDGADDYVVKPFSSEQLIARIRALLRRTAAVEVNIRPLEIGELRIDRASRTVTLGARQLELTRKEFDLLAFLAEHAGEVVSRKKIVEQVWQGELPVNNQSIDVHVSWLRGKLGESASAPRYLHTVRGVGLKLLSPP